MILFLRVLVSPSSVYRFCLLFLSGKEIDTICDLLMAVVLTVMEEEVEFRNASINIF